MRVNRADLLQVLESVQPGLTVRDVIEQSSCFAFQNGSVHSFNDEIYCQRASPLNIEGAVQAVPLLNILRRLSEDELDIQLTDGELILRGKRRRAGIRTQAEVALPIEKVEQATDWKKLHEDFSDAIYVAQQCVGKDESNYAATCIHVHPKYVEACDDHQAVRYKLKTRVSEAALIRGASIKHIVSLDMTEFAETETWIHFRNPTGLILSCRRDLQAFDPLDDILKVEGEPLTLPKGLAEAAEKAEIFSSENPDENEVLVDIRPGRLKVKGQGVSGWYHEFKKLKYSGEPLSFSIGPRLLVEIVKRYSECTITQTKLKVDTGKFVYVVALGKNETEKAESNGEAK
jgi:hypothetical protein